MGYRTSSTVGAVFAGMALSFLLSGCAQLPSTGSAGPPMRHKTWWNFYLRGVDASHQGNYAAAARDLESCLGLRPGAAYGYPVDSWRVRTYGVHFLDDYFPQRELGICYYQLGQVSNAISLLEKSLKQEPSGRARYYLNQARAALVRHQGLPPPSLRLSADVPMWNREKKLAVAGTVSAAAYVQEVRVNGHPLFFELAAPSLVFTQQVALREGSNTIALSARDLANQTTQVQWQIMADWQPPVLAILQVEHRGAGWSVQARGIDPYGVHKIMVAGQVICEKQAGDACDVFTFDVPDNQPVAIQLQDYAGNSLSRLCSPDHLRVLAQCPREQFAALSQEGRADVPPASGKDAVSAAQAEPLADALKPALRLGTPLNTRVFNNEFLIEGTASDGGGLKSISINGEEMLDPASRGCVQFHFARRLSLDLGTNVFSVRALDLAGNRDEKKCAIVCQAPDYLDETYRLCLGVPPVHVATGSLESISSEYVGRLIEQELVREPPRFNVLERADGWDQLLAEQRLSASELADPRAALRIGKLIPAELLVMTLLFPQGRGLTIFSRVVDTTSGAVLCAEDVYVPDPSHDLKNRVEGLVLKVEQQFPLMNGKILSHTADKATVSVGAAQGLKPGMRFLLLDGREDANAGEGAVRLFEGQPVELNVLQIFEARSTARIHPAAAAAAIMEGDVIYAR